MNEYVPLPSLSIPGSSFGIAFVYPGTPVVGPVAPRKDWSDAARRLPLYSVS